MKGVITKIQRFSLHDGPGIRTTVFLKGCPLACVWCQNPENISIYSEVLFLNNRCLNCLKCLNVCPKGCFAFEEQISFKSKSCNRCGLCIETCPVLALEWSSREATCKDILSEIIKDKLYYDISGGGVTLSGGEPLAQPEFCFYLIKDAKSLGLHVVVDTCGYASGNILEKIIPFVDLFLFDLKFIDNRLHKEYTGKSNDIILDNFKLLCQAKKSIIVRVPIIARKTDTQENLLEIKEFVGQFDAGIKIDYVPFNPLMRQKYGMLGGDCPLKTS